MSLRLVVSIEAGTGTEWQASLLCYSRLRAAEPAPLTVICAGGAPRQPMPGADVLVTPTYRHLDMGTYPPFNKPCGLADWLRVDPPAEDRLLLLDPDMVILEPLPAAPDHARGDLFPDMAANLSDTWVRNLCRHPELLQAVGVPVWLPTQLLIAIVPGWIAQTRALRRADALHQAWTAEMVGYELAAADLGVTHEMVVDSCGPTLVHYFPSHCGFWWRKSNYRPWQEPLPVQSANPTLRAFRDLLSEYAALRRAA